MRAPSSLAPHTNLFHEQSLSYVDLAKVFLLRVVASDKSSSLLYENAMQKTPYIQPILAKPPCKKKEKKRPEPTPGTIFIITGKYITKTEAIHSSALHIFGRRVTNSILCVQTLAMPCTGSSRIQSYHGWQTCTPTLVSMVSHRFCIF